MNMYEIQLKIQVEHKSDNIFLVSTQTLIYLQRYNIHCIRLVNIVYTYPTINLCILHYFLNPMLST